MRDITFILVFLFSINSFASDQNCDFYKSKNKEFQCSGQDNYLLDYGLKYCERFTELESNEKSSKELKGWISRTRLCLQEMIRDNEKRYKNEGCKQLKDFAFDVHPICYKQYGVCNLSLTDKSRVAKILVKNDFITDFEKEKRATFMQMGNVLTSCLAASDTISSAGEVFYNLFLKSKVDITVIAVEYAVEIIDRAPDTIKEMQSYFEKVLKEMKKDETKNVSAQQMSAIFKSGNMQYDQSFNLAIHTGSTSNQSDLNRREVIAVQAAFNDRLTLSQLKAGLDLARRLTSEKK